MKPAMRELMNDLEEFDTKHGVDHRDYAGQVSFFQRTRERVSAEFGDDSWYTALPKDMSEAQRAALASYQEQTAAPPPYQDFWHHVLDVYDNVGNDRAIYMNWARVRDAATEDWQRELGQMFVDDYGAEDIFYWISW